MGLIANRLAEFSETRFDRAAWLNDDDDDGPATTAGVRVGRASAWSIPTVMRCVDILATSVSGSPRDVVIKVGGRTFPEYSNVPRWVDEPDPTDPTLTGDRYLYSLVSSLVLEGNYFVGAYPNILAPEVLTALDPNRVRTPAGTSDFEILDERGQVSGVLGPLEMLHGIMYPWPGQRRGISPLEYMRRTFGASIAADDFAARFFGQGAALSFGVEVPTQMTDEQKESLRRQMKAKYQGNRNSHAIGVLTAGAKFVGGLAPTPEQAQMLETRKFSVEEIAGRIFGVPPYMVGSQEPGAASYASTTTAKETFAERTVLPLVLRIEAQHNRLLADFRPVAGGKAQYKLNMDHLLRADLVARFQAYETGIRSGVLKPDEARDKENLGPVPGGDRVYMQAQMTPIEMLGQPVAATAPTRSELVEDRMLDAITRPQQPIEMHTHLTAESLRIEPPVVNIPAFPEIPAPIVNIEGTVVNVPAPIVTLAPADVRVDVPAQPAPIVNVTTPDTLRIVSMPTRRTIRKVVKRDPKGAIAETQDIEEDV